MYIQPDNFTGIQYCSYLDFHFKNLKTTCIYCDTVESLEMKLEMKSDGICLKVIFNLVQ